MAGWIVAQVSHTSRAIAELVRSTSHHNTPQSNQAPIITHSFKYRERWGRVIKTGELFPHYLFIGGDWRAWLGQIYSCHYVYNIVTSANDGAPSVVRDDQVSILRQQEDREGFIWLTDHSPSFTKNQRVRVAAGPFQGFTGFVKGTKAKDRVAVMMMMFGSQREILLPVGELLAA